MYYKREQATTEILLCCHYTTTSTRRSRDLNPNQFIEIEVTVVYTTLSQDDRTRTCNPIAPNYGLSPIELRLDFSDNLTPISFRPFFIVSWAFNCHVSIIPEKEGLSRTNPRKFLLTVFQALFISFLTLFKFIFKFMGQMSNIF